ncbi:MAG TPA: 3-deoxy-manno-octulosonate cytidylyltransferase [Gemmatimonadaceae bacterium]|nr:3-deoxy-manno-octulosonate cytidylyltransferase [Gemmatimonadaceae bacterium]
MPRAGERARVVTAVIPARMASTRYAGKPLARIMDLPMIEHVRRRALLADVVDRAVVATCDSAIIDAVEGMGGEAVMTKASHERCTERVAEAIEHVRGEIIVMVQGDEPLLVPDAITRVVAPLLADASLGCSNLLCAFVDEKDRESPDVVKAACDRKGDIIYFTRAAIPIRREQVSTPVYRQTGIIAFTRELLQRYIALPPTPLERAESIDMLRLVEHGIRIAGVVTSYNMFGVDWPDDVAVVETELRSNPEQRALHERIQHAGARA